MEITRSAIRMFFDMHLEEGVGQWLNALVASEKKWEVHCADQVADIFKESNLILNINNKRIY